MCRDSINDRERTGRPQRPGHPSKIAMCTKNGIRYFYYSGSMKSKQIHFAFHLEVYGL